MKGVVVLQVCFCGWAGRVEDQRVVYVGEGEFALECPGCGRHDRLEWLSEQLRDSVLCVAAERAADVARGEPALVP